MKSCIRIEKKNDFWAFKTLSKMPTGLALACFDTLKCQKSTFPNSMTTFNGTTAKLRSKAEKTIETPHLK